MSDASMLTPRATHAGTAAFRKRFEDTLAPGHFRQSQDLWMSSIGLGTYLGKEDDDTDRLYREAIREALRRGCNVVDSAINYRHQRSERAIGKALEEMFETDQIGRAEVIIATKGGYIPFEGAVPADPEAFIKKTYLDPGIATPDDIVQWNCIAPAFISDQIERSLKNLRVKCIDIYYLHNPEAQLERLSPMEFYQKLRETFGLLERKVAEGKLAGYGLATWDGFRQPSEEPNYLSLSEVRDVAEDVAGRRHHFKTIQLPYNLAMTEALTRRNQMVGGEPMSLLEAARELGITVMTSVPTFQGRLSRNLPAYVGEILKGLTTDAQRAIQFARSSPGVVTALVGMKQKPHVVENLFTAQFDPVPADALVKLFEQE